MSTRDFQLEAVPGRSICVFERRPRWTPELQRQFQGRKIRVCACRTIGDVRSTLDKARAAVLLLELEAGAGQCLQFLESMMTRMPPTPTLVIGSLRTAALEWPTRELGAVDFLFDDTSGKDVARLCERQWNTWNDGLPSPP